MSMRAIKVFSSQFNFFLVCWNRGAAPTVLLAALILSIISMGNTGLQMCFFKRFFGVNYSFSSSSKYKLLWESLRTKQKEVSISNGQVYKGAFCFHSVIPLLFIVQVSWLLAFWCRELVRPKSFLRTMPLAFENWFLLLRVTLLNFAQSKGCTSNYLCVCVDKPNGGLQSKTVTKGTRH